MNHGTYRTADQVRATVRDRMDAERVITLNVEGSGALKASYPFGTDDYFIPDTAAAYLTVNRRGVRRVTLGGFVQKPADGKRPARMIRRRAMRAYELEDLRGRRPAAVKAVYEAIGR